MILSGGAGGFGHTEKNKVNKNNRMFRQLIYLISFSRWSLCLRLVLQNEKDQRKFDYF